MPAKPAAYRPPSGSKLALLVMGSGCEAELQALRSHLADKTLLGDERGLWRCSESLRIALQCIDDAFPNQDFRKMFALQPDQAAALEAYGQRRRQAICALLEVVQTHPGLIALQEGWNHQIHSLIHRHQLADELPALRA